MDYVDDLCMHTVLQKVWRKFACRAETALTNCQGFLGLGVEGRIINESVDKNPQIALHVVGLHVSIFVLLIYNSHNIICYLISNVIDMSPTLDSCNPVHKADLLNETPINNSRTYNIQR